MDLLGEWFDKHDTGLIIHYPLVPQAEQVLEAQRAYCNKIHLQHTPFITINERKMPGIYTIEDLHYVHKDIVCKQKPSDKGCTYRNKIIYDLKSYHYEDIGQSEGIQSEKETDEASWRW